MATESVTHTTVDGPGVDDRSTAQLVQQVSTQVSELVRDEMALATAELKQKGTQARCSVW